MDYQPWSGEQVQDMYEEEAMRMRRKHRREAAELRDIIRTALELVPDGGLDTAVWRARATAAVKEGK